MTVYADPPQNGQSHRNDDEYKVATKEVVDDMLREDVLGPRICANLTNHTPASDKVKSIVADAISKEPALKKAIEGVIDEIDTKRKSKWIDRALGAIGVLIFGDWHGINLRHKNFPCRKGKLRNHTQTLPEQGGVEMGYSHCHWRRGIFHHPVDHGRHRDYPICRYDDWRPVEYFPMFLDRLWSLLDDQNGL